MKKPVPVDMEAWLRGVFERNYQRLRYESGHTLSPEIKETALKQIIFYWRKLQALAESITDTEVRLHLPNRVSEGGHKFGIEGVVDIVREGEKTVMYDLKTHDPDYIRANLGEYEEQLNVYAYIWCALRGQSLTDTAIVTTQFPQALDEALHGKDLERISLEFQQWDPVIKVDFNPEHVTHTIKDFGDVVDRIESGKFDPPALGTLKKVEVKGRTFATRVCRNCDIRFSCDPFLKYAKDSPRERKRGVMKFVLEDASEDEVEDIYEAGLGA